jgi:hypothetical protein
LTLVPALILLVRLANAAIGPNAITENQSAIRQCLGALGSGIFPFIAGTFSAYSAGRALLSITPRFGRRGKSSCIDLQTTLRSGERR